MRGGDLLRDGGGHELLARGERDLRVAVEAGRDETEEQAGVLGLGRRGGGLGAAGPQLRLARLAVAEQAAAEAGRAGAALGRVGDVVAAHELAEAAVGPHRAVDLGEVGVELGVAEEIAGGGELDAGVVVGVDGRAGGERLELLGAEQEVGEDVVGRREAAAAGLGAGHRIAEGASR